MHIYRAALPSYPSAPSLTETTQVASESQAPCPAGAQLTSCEGINRSNPSILPCVPSPSCPSRSAGWGQGRNQAKKQLDKRGYVNRDLVNSCHPVWRCQRCQLQPQENETPFILPNCIFLLRGRKDYKVFPKEKGRSYGIKKGE